MPDIPAEVRAQAEPDPPHVREDYREVWLSGWRAGRAAALLAAERRGAQPEICICAAIQLPNGEVWRGHRHNDAIHTAMQAPDVWRKAVGQAVQGFITSRNRFVDREEGARLQREAGVVSFDTQRPVSKTLFSEDLYLRDWRSPSSSAAQPAERKETK